MRGLLTRWHADMRVVVERYGGTVEKFSGDDVMAVRRPLGPRGRRAGPSARRSRCERGRPVDREVAAPQAWRPCRIGVNTGEVLAGEPGHAEAFVTGDAVNLAKRLEQSAETGEILLGEATYPFVRDAVTVGARRQLTVKGKRDVVTALPLDAVDPWAAGWARRLDVPLVGRSVELERVRGVFERVLSERRCLPARSPGRPESASRGSRPSCSARSAGRRPCCAAGASPTARGSRTGRSASSCSSSAATRRSTACSPTRRTRSGSRVRTAIGRDDGPLRSEETFWAVRRLFEALASRSPLVVCVEDVHWAEPPFLDLLEYVAQWSDSAPILLLCMARGDLVEQRPEWAGVLPTSTYVPLSPLSVSESQALLDHVRGEALISEDTRTALLAAAEGNPLFVEQMTAMAAESDGELIVPPTIQALIAQRLDRLSRDERVVLECAAVSGSDFLQGDRRALPARRAQGRGTAPARARLVELVRPHTALLPGQDGSASSTASCARPPTRDPEVGARRPPTSGSRSGWRPMRASARWRSARYMASTSSRRTATGPSWECCPPRTRRSA